MQPQTYTALTSLGFSLFIWLLVFLGAAWGINKVLKRKVVNGALFFLAAGGIFLVIHLVAVAHSPLGAEGIGAIIGTYLFPALLGVYLARKFEKQKNTQKRREIAS